MLQSIQALSVILLFLLINGAGLVIAGVILSYYDDAANARNSVTVLNVTHGDVLRYQGVLYIGDNDKPVDCYRHCGTNAVYYKQGRQYRSAITGRIVSNDTAYAGTY